jgi:hypothetical protein
MPPTRSTGCGNLASPHLLVERVGGTEAASMHIVGWSRTTHVLLQILRMNERSSPMHTLQK